MIRDSLHASTVAVAAGFTGYGARPPYSPTKRYPEYPFTHRLLHGENLAYDAVRESLRLLGLDGRRFGTSQWNPLGEIIAPGATLLLKPNFVREFRESNPDDADCIITHGAVIRAVVDYVYIATGGEGRIIIADAPQNDADFGSIRRLAGLEEIQEFYSQNAAMAVEVYDLRRERALKRDGVIIGHERLPGDPSGYVCVDLGPSSAFAEIEEHCSHLYGSEYDVTELRAHHGHGRHEYLISRTVLDADVVISLAKLKTHKKTGLTVNLKNLVGINGNKNWLPHHREGTPSQGGDEFADDSRLRRVERFATRLFKRLFPAFGPLKPLLAVPAKRLGARIFGDTNVDTIRSGNWWGNDTTWRMVLDLNRILLYSDNTGQLHSTPVRHIFSIVDGIVAGERNGPLDPTPKEAGIVVAGGNSLAVDLVCARLMGFDYKRLPLVLRGLESHPLPLSEWGPADVTIVSNDEQWDRPLRSIRGKALAFRPHFGWLGHVEIEEPEGAPAERISIPISAGRE